MGRMQCKGKGKGISSTVTPFKRRSPKWVSHTPKSISELIVTMAKKGMSPSQIGVAIRDKEAVPSIKLLTGQKIVRLLKKNGEDLVMQVVLQKSLKMYIAWSRRQWTSGGTWRSAEKTEMPNIGLFWSNLGSIGLADITEELKDYPTSGDSNNLN